MNAGAYGGEIKDCVKDVTYLDIENNKLKTISNQDCNFTYRNSIFSDNKKIIVNTTLELEYGVKEEIESKMKEYLKSRKDKQPLEYPSAGSSFKRGNDFITAKLIDECGLKGYTIGGAQVSEKHAGFIINKGDAKANDVISLVRHIKKIVFEKTNKNIELEIKLIGNF